MSQRVAAAFAAGLLLVACPDDSRAKSEAAVVSRAVTALREADNEQKRALLSALRDAPCSTEDVCAVRSACLAAYELHTRTLERTSAAPRSSAAPDPGFLASLERDLGRARDLARACADAQGELVRRYRL